MIDHHGAWLPTVWLGLPAIGLGLLLCLGLILLALRHAEDRAEQVVLSALPAIVALGLVIAPLFGYWPYSGDYHRLQPVQGVVAAVDTRFLAASQYVIVTYRDGATVRCDDSRCATVRVGDTLRLLCTKEYQYGAVNGWACRWGNDG